MTDVLEFPALKEAVGKLDAVRKSAADFFKEAGPDYNMDLVKSVAGDANAKVDWIRARQDEMTDLKSKVENLKAMHRLAEETKGYEATGNGSAGAENGATENKGEKRQNIAEMFVKSQAYLEKGKTAHLDVGLKTLFERPTGWTPEVVRSGLVTLMPMVMAPSVTDHLVTIPVSQSGYKYMEETTYTNNADGVSEGATYGEGALALTERSQNVEKVATWIPVTDEQLEDEPGAQAYVEARLQNMLRQRLDYLVLQGSGTTPEILGTVNKAGINTRALGGDTLLDALYKSYTSIRTVGFAEPSVTFLNAAAWQPVALLKTADGQYIWGNPAQGGPQAAWGIPIVQTQAAIDGTVVSGDYSNYAFLGVKRGIDLQITNAHASMFINGEQAIRVDTRVVMVHIRPTAFATITGVAA